MVPGATIEVKNADTGAVYQGGTSATGNYVIPVPVGKYSLTVTVTGFKKYVRENLVVTVATATRQDVKLEVGAVTDTVTITEATPLLKTESGEVSHNVTIDDANNLPVLTLGRSHQRLRQWRLREHSRPAGGLAASPGRQLRNRWHDGVNGLPSATEAIRIEGQDATNGIVEADHPD